MPGPLDERQVQSVSEYSIPLTQGLYLSNGRAYAPQGSLAECLNMEIVDGSLRVIEGRKRLGAKCLAAATYGINRSVREARIFVGTDGTDYTTTYTFNNGMNGPLRVEWYSGGSLTPSVQPVGHGILHVEHAALTGDSEMYLSSIEGELPDEFTYFKDRDSGETITISIDVGFHEPGAPYDDLTIGQYITGFNRINRDADYIDSTWDGFRPSPLGNGPVSHVFALNDNTYCVKDFWGVGFYSGVEEPSIGDKISIPYTSGPATPCTFYVAKAELTGGSWEAGDAQGWLYVYPQSDSTIVNANIGWDPSATITNLTTTNTLGDTVPQTSPASVITQKPHGLLWKLDTNTEINTGWKYIDAGYSVNFNGGAKAPYLSDGPIFVTDAISSMQDTGAVAFDSPATEFPTSGTYSAWSNLGNMAADDAAYASTTIAANDYSRVLTFTPTANLIPGNAKITGITVTLEAYAAAGSSIVLERVQLRNSGLTEDYINPTKHLSENKAVENNDPIDAAPEVFTFGGQLDLWGFEEITQTDFNAQDIELLVQFKNTTGGGVLTYVDYAFITVHYTIDGQELYFYDGSSDVATGTLVGYQVHDGDWSTDDARGWMSLSTMTNPSAVYAGTQIRTAASGGGELLAYAVDVSKNMLPSSYEMENALSRCRSYNSNLGRGIDNERVFVCNGVTPCFTIDKDDQFQFIRLPIDPSKDNPRYVSEISSHLVLGLEEHLFISSIATFNNFSTYDGATTWAINDTVTGLARAPDNTLLVVARDSLHRMTGSGATGQNSFALKNHSASGGGQHYTTHYLGDGVFLNNYGVSSFAASDKYGDFAASTINAGIQPWLEPRLRDVYSSFSRGTSSPVDSVAVRSKNQFRIFFGDGWILTCTYPTEEQENRLPQFTTQHHGFGPRLYSAGGAFATDTYVLGWTASATKEEYIHTCVTSYQTSWGEERLLAGTEAGDVVLLDDGPTEMGSTLYYSFVPNPITGRNPATDIIKMIGATFAWDDYLSAHMFIIPEVDFRSPTFEKYGDDRYEVSRMASSSGAKFSINDPFRPGYWPRFGTTYASMLSNGITWRVVGYSMSATGTKPAIFRAISILSPQKTTRIARSQRGQFAGTTGLASDF